MISDGTQHDTVGLIWEFVADWLLQWCQVATGISVTDFLPFVVLRAPALWWEQVHCGLLW